MVIMGIVWILHNAKEIGGLLLQFMFKLLNIQTTLKCDFRLNYQGSVMVIIYGLLRYLQIPTLENWDTLELSSK